MGQESTQVSMSMTLATFIGKKRQTEPKKGRSCSMSNPLPTNCIYPAT